MGFFLKYMAVRVWASVFFGGLAAMVILPLLTAPMGLQWVVVPGFFLCIAAFWIVDRVFSVIGHFQFNRLMGEVTAWERAGMDREARQILAQAESLADSFLFSPVSRKRAMRWLMSRIARLQLAGGIPDVDDENVVGLYLRRYPQDRDAAVRWLERILSSPATSPQIHDIAARIGVAHSDDMAVQQMLARFYLSDRRCDFDALHTYQSLMDGNAPVPENLVNGIADLFLSGHRTDPLALQVYLVACQTASPDARLLSGIAACRQAIRATVLTQPFLEKADAALASLPLSQCQDMAAAFFPKSLDVLEKTDNERFLQRKMSLGPAVRIGMERLRTGWQGWVKKTVRIFENQRLSASAGPSSRVRRVIMGVGALAATAVLILMIVPYFKTAPRVVEAPPPSAPVVAELPAPEIIAPVTDPFSLQAAAFLKETDARRFVGQLKKKGIDAYWIWTESGGKIWYQVRISHFKTKADARSYGEALKRQQIIADYYITNYKAPEAP